MSIKLHCSCGKTFKVRDDWAGKRCKCPACKQPMSIPGSAQPASGSVNEGHVADAFSDSVSAGATEAAGETACPGCGVAVSEGAMICIHCGYDFATGKKLAMSKPAAKAPRAAPRAVRPSSASKSAGGRKLISPFLSGTLILGLLLLAVIGGGWWVYRDFRDGARAEEIVSTAGKTGLDDAMQRDAEALLPRIVTLCRKSLNNPSDGAQRRTVALMLIIRSLSSQADIACVWPATLEHNGVRTALRDHIAASRSMEWMAQHADSTELIRRQIITAAIQMRYPIGEVNNGDIQSLALLVAPGTEGKSGADAIRQAIFQRCTENVVGRYHVQATLIQRAEKLVSSRGNYTLNPTDVTEARDIQRPVLTIAAEGERWTIEWFKLKWQGTIDDLSGLRLECPVAQADDELSRLPLLAGLGDRKLVLTLTAKGPVIDAAGLTTFVPGEVSADEYDYYSGPPKMTPEKIIYKIATTTKTEATRQGGVKSSVTMIWYHKPGKPGIYQVTVNPRKVN